MSGKVIFENGQVTIFGKDIQLQPYTEIKKGVQLEIKTSN